MADEVEKAPGAKSTVDLLMEVADDLRLLDLFRGHEEPRAAERPSERDAARVHGHRDGERQRGHDRQQPPHERPAQRGDARDPREGDERRHAVLPDRVAPARLGVGADLRAPGDLASQQREQNGPCREPSLPTCQYLLSWKAKECWNVSLSRAARFRQGIPGPWRSDRCASPPPG